MRLWPWKKWKKILLIVFVVFFVAGLVALAYVGIKMNSDVVSEIEILNAAGSKIALVIYHPGMTSLMKDVTYSFADGLVSNGWRVEVTTPSSEAPTDLSGYDLLVLGSPVYGFTILPTIERQLARMGDLKKIDTVGILTAAGAPGDSASTMEKAILNSNGIVKKVIVLFGMAPNEGDLSAVYLAEQAGKETLP
jgi:flavorubredoxin